MPPALRGDIARAAQLARQCLAQSGTAIPLHGDLHHDNIMGQGRNWRAIDAKGVIGCRGYEVANSFGNPLGMPELTQDPAYHSALASRFSSVLDLAERRIREWAAAHMGLALCWHLESGEAGISGWDKTLPILLAGVDMAKSSD
ncbi:hypothetical protein JQU17_01775 [Ponticoccus sp. SC2-23]|nr:hypothetical protein [Ponticoccus sp. SC6-9]MBM1224017.1 hypothetical protein [Ponticoccus sp. SC6-15]MBM1230204.1 hypothetical protein [Ponticoccus sp. SC6-38]MBM1232983.1 hypothetical protein [Ponticoccus sp. SC6-45]MBM1237067.1 hypothetical protein [Ponticoccus sp. SC6-49]MBM1241994.1 hypothetical protein [Ponticoccus sp. SC2-64]MBM1246507.1 hypothetical protein [Ponticoccus sp. SC6-42]MBM1250985.1 hypothetical protein [Ponticoccus sp. SC6-33]MBM1255076.1 hypothetical protein [Pontico